MSENISPSEPSHTYVSRAEAVVARAWGQGIEPEPLLTVSDWADRHRVLSQRAASEPDKWRTSRTPYLRAIMDDLSASSAVRRIVFMKVASLS